MSNPYDREILRLALPTLGALIAEPLYVLADTAVVGHLGTPQLGGLAVAGTLVLTGFALFIFLSYGTTPAVARLLGAGDVRAAAALGVQGLWLALLIGLALVAVALPLAPALVDLMGARGEVREHALTYLRISLAGVPALLVMEAGLGYLRGLQDTRLPLVVTAATFAANLVLEVVLIYGFDQGIGASALSTVLAQIAAAAVYVRRIGVDVAARGAPVRPDPAALRRLAVVSRDLFWRTASLRISITLGTAVAARLGTTELAAHQIAFQLWNALAIALDAIAIAGQALTGRLLGAGDATGARAAGRRMLRWGLVAGVLFAVAIAPLRSALPRLFSDDPSVLALCAFLLLVVAALQPVNALAFVLDGILIGAGDVRFLARAMAVAAAVFVPAALLVLTLGLGIGWLWGALGLLMTTRTALLLARFAGSHWEVTGAYRQDARVARSMRSHSRWRRR